MSGSSADRMSAGSRGLGVACGQGLPYLVRGSMSNPNLLADHIHLFSVPRGAIYCRSMEGIDDRSPDQGIADLHQIWRRGGNCSRMSRQPTRSEYETALTGSEECTGVPHSGQNAWLRLPPLSAVLM
jgi:hypothetical protein